MKEQGVVIMKLKQSDFNAGKEYRQYRRKKN